MPLKLEAPQIQHGKSNTLLHAAGMSMWTFPVPLQFLHFGVFAMTQYYQIPVQKAIATSIEFDIFSENGTMEQMSDFVRFTKKGLVAFDWDSEKQEYVPDPEPHPAGNIINLRTRVELEPGVTLGDVFRAVEADELLCDVISFYSWCKPIREFHAAAKIPREPFVAASEFVMSEYGTLVPVNENEEDPIVQVTLEAFGEFHRNYEDKNGPPSFEGVWWHFDGTAKSGQRYGISCTPVNELVDAVVKIEPLIHFSKSYEKMDDVLPPATITCSLLDFLDCIYWDISFHGGPTENKEFIEHLEGMVDEIKAGTAKTVPFDFKELED
jgi:hypothetical protein